MNSEYGSIASQNKNSSNSSKCYGISAASKGSKNLKIRYKAKKKTKLVFLNKSEGNLLSLNKTLRNNTICQNFFNSRSSTQSEDSKRLRGNSESSASSTNSVLHMKNNSSIEGLHNFNMKTLQNRSRDGSEYSFDTYSQKSVQSRRSNSAAMYVEEKVKIDDTKSYNLPMLQEVTKIIKEFSKIIEMSKEKRLAYFTDRVGAKRKAKISFTSEEDINKIKADKTFKINERNLLGVKSPQGWIYNLNIGNIMHLQPVDFDQMHLSFKPENVVKKTNQELNKDIILEKIVYVTVAYFCVGTEYRFLNSKIDPDKYGKKDSEIWHAKALHICSTFMPPNSPLVKHITKSYIKHHLKEKLEGTIEEEKQLKPDLLEQEEEPTIPRNSEKNRQLHTPEPELLKQDLIQDEESIKQVVEHSIPDFFKAVPKLASNNSKMDTIKTSKLVFNLNMIPKGLKKTKFIFLRKDPEAEEKLITNFSQIGLGTRCTIYHSLVPSRSARRLFLRRQLKISLDHCSAFIKEKVHLLTAESTHKKAKYLKLRVRTSGLKYALQFLLEAIVFSCKKEEIEESEGQEEDTEDKFPEDHNFHYERWFTSGFEEAYYSDEAQSKAKQETQRQNQETRKYSPLTQPEEREKTRSRYWWEYLACFKKKPGGV
ncbi:unnamed protein product [Moneuplotes crassus]|uniref:Uncharacterized protein n=1 Tax=Euplotes crassus TaxID=5936 RepID=A0AAD2D7P3_EUPCR|nr:unnamed protein product [Moneuplotes crassus]